MNTHELLVNAPGIDTVARRWLLDVVTTRGKWKGYLLTNAPRQSKDPVRWATWQAIMSFLAPARCSMFPLMLMDDETQRAFHKVDAAMKTEVSGTGWPLYIFIQAFEPPFRWNMFAANRDVDKIRELALSVMDEEV